MSTVIRENVTLALTDYYTATGDLVVTEYLRGGLPALEFDVPGEPPEHLSVNLLPNYLPEHHAVFIRPEFKRVVADLVELGIGTVKREKVPYGGFNAAATEVALAY